LSQNLVLQIQIKGEMPDPSNRLETLYVNFSSAIKKIFLFE